nr:ABC transporter substrate-binding protein [uncultured Methanospirillum sp.]
MKQQTTFIALCIIVVLCLLAVGCLNTSKTGTSAPVGNATSGANATGMSNTLMYAGENTDTINPVISSGELTEIIFSGLMKYDANGTPVVDLAESYTYDKDKKVYTFNLRKGVTWHDGKPFTSADVVYTYDTLMHDTNLSSSVRSNFKDIQSVSAPDDSTVVFTMGKDNAAMLGYFTMGILPSHLMKGNDLMTSPYNQKPVGTGRYKFVNWDTAGKMITLERNTAYYGHVPKIERVIYKTVAVEGTKATMLKTGEADLAWLNANYAKTFRDNPNYKNIDFKTADYRAISMDYKLEFWQKNGDSVGVLNYAIDKDAVVKSVLDGRGFRAYSPIQINAFGGNKAADIYSYDLNKFATEMEKLGWKKGSDGIYERNGQKFHFTVQVRDYEEERVDIANLCSRMLKDAGVEMEVVLVTKLDYTKGFNSFLAGNAVTFDPDMIFSSFVTNASGNSMAYSNPEVDALLNQGRQELDPAKRKQIYQEFEAAYAKQPGIVLVAYLDGNYVSTKGLSGLDTTRTLGHHAVGVMWNIEEWTLSK